MWLAGLRSFFVQFRIDTENLAYARWMIGIGVWIGIGFAVFLLYRLFGKWAALASFVFLASSPLFLAQTRRVHTDALAATFILLTVLLVLCYYRNKQFRYLIFSGIAFGLALLSKSYAVILLPWIPVCLFILRGKHIRGYSVWIAEGLCIFGSTALTVLVIWPVFWSLPFALLGVCLLVSTTFVWADLKDKNLSLKSHSFWINPFVVIAAWTCILRTVWTVLYNAGRAIVTPHEIEHFFFGKVVHDPGWLFYPFVLAIKSTPLMLPLAFIGCFLLWKQRNRTEENLRVFQIVFSLLAVSLLFTICLAATSKKFSRYLLPAFLIFEVLAAIGLVEGLKLSYTVLGLRSVPKGLTKLSVIVSIVFFLQIMPVFVLHPYYATYYNPCWKMTDITKIITGGDTSGIDVAAQYLNQKPEAHRLRVVVSPLGTEFFQYYFVGFAYSTRKKSMPAEYEVVYLRDSQIGRVPQTGTRGGELEKVITLNGIDHVWIYRIPEDKETAQ